MRCCVSAHAMHHHALPHPQLTFLTACALRAGFRRVLVHNGGTSVVRLSSAIDRSSDGLAVAAASRAKQAQAELLVKQLEEWRQAAAQRGEPPPPDASDEMLASAKAAAAAAADAAEDDYKHRVALPMSGVMAAAFADPDVSRSLRERVILNAHLHATLIGDAAKFFQVRVCGVVKTWGVVGWGESSAVV